MWLFCSKKGPHTHPLFRSLQMTALSRSHFSEATLDWHVWLWIEKNILVKNSQSYERKVVTWCVHTWNTKPQTISLPGKHSISLLWSACVQRQRTHEWEIACAIQKVRLTVCVRERAQGVLYEKEREREGGRLLDKRKFLLHLWPVNAIYT